MPTKYATPATVPIPVQVVKTQLPPRRITPTKPLKLLTGQQGHPEHKVPPILEPEKTLEPTSTEFKSSLGPSRLSTADVHRSSVTTGQPSPLDTSDSWYIL